MESNTLGKTTLNKQEEELLLRLQNLPPLARVEHVLSEAKNPILTTNFSPYESAIIHLTIQVKPDIPVVWCDSGYNTDATYQHALRLVDEMNLNIHVYAPLHTRKYRDHFLGKPEIGTPDFDTFTEQVKLEPFRRAMEDFKPDVWFTNVRRGQTKLRNELDIISYTATGILKVSPFYDHSDKDLAQYLDEQGVTTEFDYHDPTKVYSDRECGLHYL